MTEARKDRRAPASIKVKYKSASMTELVELLGGDVSRGGIFIKTKKPLEPGALLKFEFQLQSGEPMISGVGRVAWRRTEEGARPTLPAGMGIKFIKLNGQSRLVIDRIEAKHGPGSRFEQTDGAEIASAMSSIPPSISSSSFAAVTVPPSASSSKFGAVTVSQPPDASGTLITPLRPEATRAAAEAEAAVGPRLRADSANLNSPGRYSLQDSGRPTRSSPPLREAKASGPKPAPAAAALAATFRPPPPATDSVPPPHSSASSVPPLGNNNNNAAARSGSPLSRSSANNPVAASARATARATFQRSSSGAFASPAARATGAPPASGVPAAAASAMSGSSSGSSAAPRGALGSGAAARRSGAAIPSTRTAARDASEFLASAFTVGGAGREVRSQAHAQVERARHDPHSVDLANELFGDMSGPAAKADANTALDADPMLSDRAAPSAHAANVVRGSAANTAATPQASPRPEAVASAANDVAGLPSPRLRTSPRPTAANDQLKLALGGVVTLRPGPAGGRMLWLAGIAIVGVAIGAAVFYVQRGAPEPAPAPQPELAAAPVPAQAPPPTAAAVEAPPAAAVSVDLALSSEPPGAEVTLDGVPSGTTPTTLKLSSGKSVQLRLSAPGFVAKTETVDVTPDMPARSVALESLPYELVVKEPVGATVKALDKSVEAPAPFDLGVPFPGSTKLGEISVSVEKPGYKSVTRKLTSSDFKERDGMFRAQLSFSLAPLSAAVAKAAAAKPPVLKVVPAAADKLQNAAPPEPQAPPEPESTAAESKPAAPTPPAAAAPKEQDKPAEAAPPAATQAPATPAPTPAPTPEPAVPAEP